MRQYIDVCMHAWVKCVCVCAPCFHINAKLIYFDATIPALLSARLYCWAKVGRMNDHAVLPGSLAVTKGILVSFYYYAAPTDMFKFSACPRSSWCAVINWYPQYCIVYILLKGHRTTESHSQCAHIINICNACGCKVKKKVARISSRQYIIKYMAREMCA